MPSFSTQLVSGSKRPYDSWVFVVVPDRVISTLGSKRAQVRGTINGVSFTGTVSKGEGVYRMPVTIDFRTKAKLKCGDKVHVVMDVDPQPRPIGIPKELQTVLSADPALSELFEGLPPAHRRAWATYIGGAKRPETRLRRAAQAPGGIRSKSFPGN